MMPPKQIVNMVPAPIGPLHIKANMKKNAYNIVLENAIVLFEISRRMSVK